MTSLSLTVAAVALVAAALFGVLLFGIRTQSPRVLGVVRRTNKAAWNKQAIRTAGSAGNSTGIVEHVGRNSGKPYSTPVDVIPTDDGFVIVLPYGTHADWVRNVMANGSATIVHDGAHVDVHQPQLRHPDDVDQWFTPANRRTNRLFGIRQCLVLHRRDNLQRDSLQQHVPHDALQRDTTPAAAD